MSKVSVLVVSGDVIRVKADALITAINSGGMWFGAIDGAIHNTSGSYFHKQAAAAMPLRDGQTVVARCSDGLGNSNGFRHVIFVVDDLKRSLHEVVLNGLRAASDAGFSSVSLPTIRMGVMLGVVENTIDEAVMGGLFLFKNGVEKRGQVHIDDTDFWIYRFLNVGTQKETPRDSCRRSYRCSCTIVVAQGSPACE